MTEETRETEAPRDVPLKDRGAWPLSLSLIWLIPMFAVVVALGVAWRNWSERGPVIEVAFDKAVGVRPGQTELRYRDIPVGTVEKVSFSSDLSQVIVGIRLDKGVAPYVDADSSFWIVRPKVTTQGVTGLDTVLSGVFIAGTWDNEPGAAASRFLGQPDAPLLALGESGVTFTLHSDVGLPPEGTPILYKGVTVGRVGPSDVSGDGVTAYATAVVLKPYDRLLTSSTRFWDISGFSLSLDTSGASIDFTSIASLISGGITFETLASGGEPIDNGMAFTFYADETTAREEFILENEGSPVNLVMVFDQNLTGLQVGAQVSLGGLRLGEVTTISGIVDQGRFGDNKVRLLTTVRLNPGRLGLAAGGDEEALLTYLGQRVAQGLRARLTNASLLTGGLMIELVDLPDASPAELDRAAKPYPQMPTAPAKVTNVTATAQGLLARVDALPVEELMQEVISTLAAVREVVGSDSVKAAPEALLATLSSIQKIAESEEVAALPSQIGVLADNLSVASGQLNTILNDVQKEDVVTAVSGLIAKLDETAAALPGIADRASAVLADAEALSLDKLGEQATALLESIDKLVDQDSTRRLPDEFGGALKELRLTLEELRDGGLINNANATLASAREAAVSISEASQALPELAERLNALAGRANAMLAGYDANSGFGRDLSDAMLQIRDAAGAIERLARQIERNPNSLLTGR